MFGHREFLVWLSKNKVLPDSSQRTANAWRTRKKCSGIVQSMWKRVFSGVRPHHLSRDHPAGEWDAVRRNVCTEWGKTLFWPLRDNLHGDTFENVHSFLLQRMLMHVSSWAFFKWPFLLMPGCQPIVIYIYFYVSVEYLIGSSLWSCWHVFFKSFQIILSMLNEIQFVCTIL